MGFGRWALRLFGKAPVVLSAVATAGPGDLQVTLTWTTEENSIQVDDYKIYDSDNNLITTITGTTGNQNGGSVLLTNSTNPTYLVFENPNSYTFKIIGRNYKGESESRSFNAITPFTKPNAPTNISVAANTFNQITLSWTPPSNKGSNITSYKVYLYRQNILLTGSQYTVNHTGSQTANQTITYNSVTDGNYSVSISAINAAGEGPVGSLPSTFNIFGDPTVSTVTVTPGANQATFTFTSVSAKAGTGPIDSYNIYLNSNKTTLLGTSTTNVVTVTTRDGTNPLSYNAAGYTLYATIKTVPNGGLIESTTPLTITGVMPYSVPTNSTFTATAGDKSADFSWTFNSNGSNITSYIVYDSNDVRVNVAQDLYTDLTFNIGGLTNGTLYTYKVSAINEAGESAKTSVTVTPSRVYNPYDLSGEKVGTIGYAAETSYTYSPIKFASIQYDTTYVYALVEKTYKSSENDVLLFKINKSEFTRATSIVGKNPSVNDRTKGYSPYTDQYLITQNTNVNGYTPKKAIIDSTNMYVFAINSSSNWKVLKVNLNSSTATGVAYTGSNIIDLGSTVLINGSYTNILNIIKVGTTIYYFGRPNCCTINLSDFTKNATNTTLVGGSSLLGSSVQHILAVVYNSTSQKFYIFAGQVTASPYNITVYRVASTSLLTATSVASTDKNIIYNSTNPITKVKTITYNDVLGFIYLHVDNTIYKVDDSDLTFETSQYTTNTVAANADANYLYYTTASSLLKYDNLSNQNDSLISISSTQGYSFSTTQYEKPTGTGTSLQDAFLYAADSNNTNTNIYKIKLPYFAQNTTSTPAAPSNIVVSNKAAASGTATIAITPGASPAGVIIKEYLIEYKLPADTTWTTVSTKNTSRDIASLTVGGTYNFRARAKSTGDKTSAYSTTRSLKINGVPYGGTLTATIQANSTDSTKSDIKLDWTFSFAYALISPITSYTLQRRTTTGTITTTTPVSAQNLRTYTDSSIASGISYDYIISARNNIGSSATVTQRATADTIPSAPTVSGITYSNPNFILSWTAPTTSTTAPITGYTVRYKLTSDANYGTPIELTGTGTSYNFGSATLTRGTYYDFQIAAKNRCGTSTYVTSSNNPIGTLPNVTISLTNGTTIGNIIVNTSSSSSDFPITAYTIEYNTNSSGLSLISNIYPLPYTIAGGYTTGTIVNVRISATSLMGTSAMPADFTRITVYGPPAFTFGTPTYGDRQVTLNFTGTLNGSTIKGYNIYSLIGGNYVRFNSGASYTVTTSSTSSSYTLTALTDGTQLQRGSTYTFYGKTDNGLLSTNYTAITVTLPTLPGTPTGLAASFTSTAPITFSWTAPSPITNSAVTSYNVYYNTANNNSTDTLYRSVTGTSTSITGLTSGVTYYFTVAAVNSIGTGSKATYVTAIYPNVPGAPTNLFIKQELNLGFELAWLDPTSNGGSSITSYKIYQNGAFKETISINNTRVISESGYRLYSVGGLTKNTTYNYQISAINAVGEGTRSNTSATDTADTVPSPITNLSISFDANYNYVLSWSPPSNYTQNSLNYIISYRIYVFVEESKFGSFYSPNNDSTGSIGTIRVYADLNNIASIIEDQMNLNENEITIITNTALYTKDNKTSGIKIIKNNVTQYTSSGTGPSTGLVLYAPTETGVPPQTVDNQFYTVAMDYTNLTGYTSNRSITIGAYRPNIVDDPYPNVLRRYNNRSHNGFTDNLVFFVKSYNRYGESTESNFVTKNTGSSYYTFP